jgi:hypothetical protein
MLSICSLPIARFGVSSLLYTVRNAVLAEFVELSQTTAHSRSIHPLRSLPVHSFAAPVIDDVQSLISYSLAWSGALSMLRSIWLLPALEEQQERLERLEVLLQLVALPKASYVRRRRRRPHPALPFHRGLLVHFVPLVHHALHLSRHYCLQIRHTKDFRYHQSDCRRHSTES